MKSKEEIVEVIDGEKQLIGDDTHPMEHHEYANASGWIEALEWVLGITELKESINESSK